MTNTTSFYCPTCTTYHTPAHPHYHIPDSEDLALDTPELSRIGAFFLGVIIMALVVWIAALAGPVATGL